MVPDRDGFVSAPHVLDAFVRPLDLPMALVTGAKPTPGDSAIADDHPTLLDMLKIILKNEDKTFPPQLRANVCTLFGTVFGGVSKDGSAAKTLEIVKVEMKQSLADIVAVEADKEEPVVQAASKKILDLWSEN